MHMLRNKSHKRKKKKQGAKYPFWHKAKVQIPAGEINNVQNSILINARIFAG